MYDYNWNTRIKKLLRNASAAESSAISNPDPNLSTVNYNIIIFVLGSL